MEFEIVDCFGHKWELSFGDRDVGQLFFQGHHQGSFGNERDAIAHIEWKTGGKIKLLDQKGGGSNHQNW